jgi:hypothetical protein
LDVKEVRPVLSHAHGEIESETHERIRPDAARSNTRRQKPDRIMGRYVRDEFAFAVLGRKSVQKTANVDLIPGEVPADGVSINGKTH